MNWIIFKRAMFCVEDDRCGPVAAIDHILERDGRRAPGPSALVQLDAPRRCVCRRVETDVGTVGRAAIARVAAIGLPERARVSVDDDFLRWITRLRKHRGRLDRVAFAFTVLIDVKLAYRPGVAHVAGLLRRSDAPCICGVAAVSIISLGAHCRRQQYSRPAPHAAAPAALKRVSTEWAASSRAAACKRALPARRHGMCTGTLRPPGYLI